MVFWIAAALLTAICVTFVWQALFAHLPASRNKKILAIIVAVVIPLCALSLYWRMGSVGMPDFSSKMAKTNMTPRQAKMMMERPLIQELRKNTKNEDTWLQLIAVYIETDRMDLARQAHADALISVPNPTKLNDPELVKMLNKKDAPGCQPPEKC